MSYEGGSVGPGRLIAALDLGSSKTVAIVARVASADEVEIIGLGVVEAREQRQGHHETGDRDGQRQPAGDGTALGADGENQQRAEDGDPDGQAEQVGTHRILSLFTRG